jgi:predicted PurR-regulated permease PerM
MAPPTESTARQPVPYRTILASIGLVLATVVLIEAVLALQRILTWLVVAAFFAVILNPAVAFLVRRAHIRRTISAFLVFLVGLGLLAGMIYSFVQPLVDQSNKFADDFPTYVADARAGKGTIGHLVKKYKIDDWVDKNQAKLQKAVSTAGKPALKLVRSVLNTAVALITIMVLTFLMLVEGPAMLKSGVGALSPPHRTRVEKVGADCARAITGYVAGNLLISVIAAGVTYVSLWILGVPFRGVLALWVAFADLIPLVGATLGAIPTIGVAFLHNTVAGIVMIIVFIVYQQFENHVLQVTIMARTVALNPLMVLVSVLVGVELFGFLGALLAIPAAGIIQVIGRDIYDERRGRLKAEPTVGADEIPIEQVHDGEVPVEEAE